MINRYLAGSHKSCLETSEVNSMQHIATASAWPEILFMPPFHSCIGLPLNIQSFLVNKLHYDLDALSGSTALSKMLSIITENAERN